MLSFITLETNKHCFGAKGVVLSEDKPGCSKALYQKTNAHADKHQIAMLHHFPFQINIDAVKKRHQRPHMSSAQNSQIGPNCETLSSNWMSCSIFPCPLVAHWQQIHLIPQNDVLENQQSQQCYLRGDFQKKPVFFGNFSQKGGGGGHPNSQNFL